MPIDPLSGGTWIGVNDHGVALSLLNLHVEAEFRVVPAAREGEGPPGQGGDPRAGEGAALLSRGGIIPALLVSRSAREAAARAASISPGRYRPFRLLIVDGENVVELRADRDRLRERSCRLGARPLLFTSSGLGDAVVDAPRRELFEEMLLEGGDLTRLQDAFHRHSWPNRPHLSVCMRGRSARTVSYTVIETGERAARMIHCPGPPDTAAPLPAVELPFGARRSRLP